MKYQKYPAQTIKVAGDLRRAPATFENPEWEHEAVRLYELTSYLEFHEVDASLAKTTKTVNHIKY